MLEFRATTRFKKEVKKAARQQKDMRKLGEVIDLLQAGEPLPTHNLDHALTGNYSGHREMPSVSRLAVDLQNRRKYVDFNAHGLAQ